MKEQIKNYFLSNNKKYTQLNKQINIQNKKISILRTFLN